MQNEAEDLTYCWNRFRRDFTPLGNRLDPGPLSPEFEAFLSTIGPVDPSPLHWLPGLSASLGVGALFVKDESSRLGINSFKILGAAYALFHLLRERGRTLGPDTVLSAASEGNHGRAVARLARRLGLRCVVFVPEHTVKARREAIEGEGAALTIVSGSYDDSVREMVQTSRNRGYEVISDVSFAGCTKVPRWVAAGYSRLFLESFQQMLEQGCDRPDLVLLQGGVGCFASGGVQALRARYGDESPRIVVVEPVSAACLQASARSRDGVPTAASGRLDTIMAGLNCGFPSEEAWPILRDGVDLFLAVADGWTRAALRMLHRPTGGDPPIAAGESGAAGLAGLLALMNLSDDAAAGLRKDLDLGPETRILLVNTEGITDPEGLEVALAGEEEVDQACVRSGRNEEASHS